MDGAPLDQIAHSAQPRARGRGVVSARLRATRSRLQDLHQAGSAKILLPNGAQSSLDAVMLNTAGGVTGGDRFEWTAAADAGATLRLSTQAAERAYKAQPGQTGTVDVRLRAAKDATLHWLPQETILFDGCHISRKIDVDMAGTARVLITEPIIFGRTAMNEQLSDISLRDRWNIRRDGTLVYADALRVHSANDETLDRPGVLAGNRAAATVALFAEDAESYLTPLRALLPDTGGCSLIRPGVLAARLMARDGFSMRRALIPILELLGGGSLPKVWKL